VLIALVALGASYPLTDPDLPLHLLIGEWIANHRTLPTVEPFAWTRAGEPYYAYSWLPELVFYAGERVGGAGVLRLIHGLLTAAAAWAMMRLGRVAGWPRGVILVMVAMHVAALGVAVPSLRPQAVLFITLPLAWSAMHGLLARPDCRRSLAVLFASSTLSAASHLFFPITAVPLIGLWVGRSSVSTRMKAAAAVVAGWLVSPYSLAWPSVFALNFSSNALLGRDSPIVELRPGFSFADGVSIEMAFVLAVSAAVFWGVMTGPLSDRARVAALALCVCGIAAFAYATRLMIVFWLLVAPIAGHVLMPALARESRMIAIRVVGTLAIILAIASIVQPRHLRAWAAEGFNARSLAWPEDGYIQPAIRQWACFALGAKPDRVFTRLRYANMLAWHLRPHSMSIDSRTIFPDSVTMNELAAGKRIAHPGPWRSADAAILDRLDPLASVLDTTSGWLAVPPAMSGYAGAMAANPGTPLLWLNTRQRDVDSLAERCACAAGVE